MRTSTLFAEKKTTGFSKFMVFSYEHWGRGLSQYGHFADKGIGVNFSRFCVDVLYGRPLAPIISVLCKIDVAAMSYAD